jgi:hypothetical protein
MVVTGDDVVFDLEQNKGSILASPVLTDDSQDSDFKVTGGRMHLDQVNKVVAAAEGVTVLSEEATVTCDTLTLFYEDNKGDAFGNVVLSNQDGRVDADSADFTILDRRLEEIGLYPQVVTRYRTEGSDSVTLTSRSLTMDLREEKKEVMYFTGGVSGIYYWIEETPQE